ncbi:MAG: sulfatase-like hydrolase/transferase [Pseudomonadota bacterium]
MNNNFFYIIMDSCRYDSFMRAKTPNMDRIGEAEKRYSFATWTAPSHFTYLMGQTPHTSPRRVFASEVYKEEFAKWMDRLGTPNLSFKTFVPHLSLPKVLKDLGYYNNAMVSMPVLNELTVLNRNFDDYRLMEDHNDFGGMVERVDLSKSGGSFYFLNLGETHYPYMLKDAQLPRISGLHGVAKGMDDLLTRSSETPTEEPEFFSKREMDDLNAQQVRCVEHVDAILGDLISKCPDNTYFIITADHGELFGEDDYFGHGPIMHEKCMEVPYLEGFRPL